VNQADLLEERPRFSWKWALAIVAIAFASYAIVLTSANWIWDDPEYVLRNPNFRFPDGLERIWTDTSATPQYYPLVHTTFYFEFKAVHNPDDIWTEDLPAGLFHFNNVLLFALTALVFWKVLLRLRIRGALIAVLLFAAHPVNVESVAWVTERKNMLSGLFGMLAVLCFLRFARIGDEGDDGAPKQERTEDLAWKWFGVAFVCWALGLLSKSVIAFVPPALFLILWWKRPKDCLRASHIVPLLLLLIPGAAAGLHTAWLERHQVGASDRLFPELDGLMDRIMLSGSVVWTYFKHFLVPYRQIFFYEKWDPSPASIWQWILLLTAIGLPVFLLVKSKVWGRGPLVAILIFGGALFPVMGFNNVYPMRFSWVADHFQYHANFAMYALLGALLVRLPIPRNTGRAALGVTLVAFVGLSNYHGMAFENVESLYRRTLAHNPTSSISWGNLGAEIMGRANTLEQEGDQAAANELYDEALIYYQKGEALAPDDPHLGISLCSWYIRRYFREGKVADVENAEARARRLLKIWPNYWMLSKSLGDAVYLQGRQNFPEAMKCYEDTLQGLISDRMQRTFAREKLTRNPMSGEIMAKLSECYLDAGIDALARNDAKTALDYWSRGREPWQEGSPERWNDLMAWSFSTNKWFFVELHRLWLLAASIDGSVRDPERALREVEELLSTAGPRLQAGGTPERDSRIANLVALEIKAAALANLQRYQVATQVSGDVIRQLQQLGGAPQEWFDSVIRRNGAYRDGKGVRIHNDVPLPREFAQ